MATVENVKLEITESATKPGFSDLSYSYELHPDEDDRAAQRQFTVSVGIWGEDLLDDDLLAADMDEHQVGLAGTAAGEPVRIQRVFEVETKLLDEDMFGDDEVFLIVEAHCNGERVSGKSNIVVGDF